MSSKYIHYCWFGDKPLSRLAKKCIKSWKKYFPDYEIIKWSEKNVDINECPFIKEAYDNRKWAFVADYARTKALNEMGGIYFDTDMIIKKDMSNIINKSTVLGFEDSRMVNAAIWYEPKPNGYISSKLLEFYRKQERFLVNDMYTYSIPRLITKLLIEIGLDTTSEEIQKLDNNISIYPREYFYPLSYNYHNNVFTDNTVAIHYFDATWIPKWEQRENKIIRRFGEKRAQKIISLVRFVKRNIKRAAKCILFPIVLIRRYNRNHPKKYRRFAKDANKDVLIKQDYVVFVNPEWFGVYNATIELFNNHVTKLGELRTPREIEKLGKSILSNNSIKQVYFSAMCLGWKDLIIYLKEHNKNIKIKTFWHGNHSQVSEPYGWQRNEEIFDLHKDGYIDIMGTCKESLIDFYKFQGFKPQFITNIVNDDVKELTDSPYNDKKIHIGLYAAKSDDWRKNMYSQIAAASLVKNAVIDMVPLNDDAIRFASLLHVPIQGIKGSLPRTELIKRMSKNDINLYVTFSECAPMVILESFAVGVPCISGNNHHYFKKSIIHDYVIVNNESSPTSIKEKIDLCLKNKDMLLNEYKKWENQNVKDNKNQLKEFIER